MTTSRKAFLRHLLAGAMAAAAGQAARAQASKTGIPGRFRGRVVAVNHPSPIVSGAYQPQTIQTMMQRGMTELTGAPSWQDAWRTLFEKSDVVGIKVSPVGGPKLCSDPTVLHEILAGLDAAGVPAKNIVLFSRYRAEIRDCGMDKWISKESRWTAPAETYDNIQLGMDGYDPDHYMDMALVHPGQNVSDAHNRRSYVSRVVTRDVNKFINLPVLKHHQSAGVTIALKNMSHGMVNNVSRSHSSPVLNACGSFIPAVVNLPVIREKAVLHICDGLRASYHGGPGPNPRFIWEHKTMYFATDPVALDRIGWKAIDDQRVRAGMAVLLEAKPDEFSHFHHSQVEHIEIAGALGLGEHDLKKIDLRRINIT